MKILLAIDGSNARKGHAGSHCAAASERPDVRVIHVVNWEHIVPISLQFERGSEAAHAYQALRDVTVRDAAPLWPVPHDNCRTQVWHQHRRSGRRAMPDNSGLCRRLRPDLIVLGSRGKSRLDRLLLAACPSTSHGMRLLCGDCPNGQRKISKRKGQHMQKRVRIAVVVIVGCGARAG